MILCESDPTVVECVRACMPACVSGCAHACTHFPSQRIHSSHQILKKLLDPNMSLESSFEKEEF